MNLSQAHAALVLDPPDVQFLACLRVAALQSPIGYFILSGLNPIVFHLTQNFIVSDQMLLASTRNIAALVTGFELARE